MTQEEKQLLLIDLCARLPYKVMGHATWTYLETDKEVKYAEKDRPIEVNDLYAIWDFKPYLRPLSSMTEEERKELSKLCNFITFCHDYDDFGHLGIEILTDLYDKDDYYIDNNIDIRAIDWLNQHHFDYRKLIEKGLALEAPKEMYKTSEL